MTVSSRSSRLGIAALAPVLALLAACGSSVKSGSPYATETSSALGSDQCVQVAENGTAAASCPAGQTITAVSFASYGTPSGMCGDFTASSCNASTSLSVAQATCVGKNACSVAANNGVFGDPCYGTNKSFALEVTCSGAGSAPVDAGSTGGSSGTDVCASAAEQGEATLACPSGQTIDGIVFASYGSPTGTCQSFQTTSCNATTSLSTVQADCEGKSSCTVAANNGVFGDPCPGTQKALFLEAHCSGGTGASPTPPADAGGGNPGTGGTCSYDVSLAAAGGHNTSAFPTYDQAHFPANFGTSTWITQSGQTLNIDPTKEDLSENPVTPGHVSGVDVHTLIPSRPDLRWFAHLTPWFDQDNNGHVDIGLNNNTPAYVASMIADVKRRGFDGIIIDWYGKGHYTDTFVQLLKANLATRTAQTGKADFTYMIMLDQGIAGLNESVLEQQVNYVQSEYGADSAYEKEGGKPILLFIGVDNVVGQPAMYTAKANTGSASVWVNQGVDASETWVDQTYDWAHADGDGVSTTDRYNLTDIEGYYGAVAWVGTRKGFGAMMSGFNGMLTRSTSWSKGLYLPRDSGACQMAWAAKTNAVIPPQITRMQWATWSDWEEGTSIEGGVENDAQVTASISGKTVSWNVTTGTGDESTIDHYEIYAAKTASPDAAVDLGSVPAGTHTFSLAGTSCALASGGTYRVTVDAIGRPNIRDHLSAAVGFTAP